MESNSATEKEIKRKIRQNFVQKTGISWILERGALSFALFGGRERHGMMAAYPSKQVERLKPARKNLNLKISFQGTSNCKVRFLSFLKKNVELILKTLL